MGSQYFCEPCQHTIEAACNSKPDADSDVDEEEVGETLNPSARAHDRLAKSGFEPSGSPNKRNSVYTHNLQRNLQSCRRGEFYDSDDLCSSDSEQVRQ